MTAPTMQEQANAMLRRARVGIVFAAEFDNEQSFQFWSGYADAATNILEGISASMAVRDAEQAGQPQTRHKDAGAILPKSTKGLTLAQVRQIIAIQAEHRLMEAAPDLLAALRRLIKINDELSSDGAVEALGAARAAITKATGQQGGAA